MARSHSPEPKSNLHALHSESGSALERLHAFVEARRTANQPATALENFERELHALFAAAECEVMGEELARFDLDVPEIVVAGIAYRRVLRCPETYVGSAGPIRVERSLYSSREPGARAICPLELRGGIVQGRWTPLAAMQVTWVVAHLTPGEAESLFERLGGMKPSKSSLDRLPKELGDRWEEAREKFEAELRSGETIPTEATTVAVSLDGVLVPMKEGRRKEKRAAAAEAGKETRGPAGYEEASCGTVSLYDAEGERLQTIRFARMPEGKKATLKQMLKAELMPLLAMRPDLRLTKLADGARDNWVFLSKELPDGDEVADFYHAGEHLNAALTAAYGETSTKRRAQFEKLRHVLRHEPTGIEKVIRSLVHLRKQHPRSKKIAKELKYFRRNRRRMRYEELASQKIAIGSGIVEAACKTLATQRLKRSGMRWCERGGQAILTFRALVQSNRFDRGWALLAATYCADVTLPAKVVPLARAG